MKILVLKPGVGWVGINRQEQVLFKAFIFDNGPDYPAEGVLRIVGPTGLLGGYADTATGRVVLAPRYEAAFPFGSGWAAAAAPPPTVSTRGGVAPNGLTSTTRASRGPLLQISLVPVYE